MRASRCAALVLVAAGTFLIDNPALAQECPRLLGRYARGWTSAVAVSGDHVYFGNGSALMVAERAEPGALPLVVGEVETSAMVTGISMSGQHAFVAGDGGLRIVDVSSPDSPLGIGHCAMPGVAEDVAVLGSHAYVVGGEWGLRVVDASAPSSPVEVGWVDTPGWAADVAVDALASGSYAFVADGAVDPPGVVVAGLRVVDVTEPGSPRDVGELVLEAQGGSTRPTVSHMSPASVATVWQWSTSRLRSSR